MPAHATPTITIIYVINNIFKDLLRPATETNFALKAKIDFRGARLWLIAQLVDLTTPTHHTGLQFDNWGHFCYGLNGKSFI